MLKALWKNNNFNNISMVIIVNPSIIPSKYPFFSLLLALIKFNININIILNINIIKDVISLDIPNKFSKLISIVIANSIIKNILVNFK